MAFSFFRKVRGIDEEPIGVVSKSEFLDDAPGIDNVTKNDLINIASENGIKVDSRAKKDEIYKKVFGG